MPTSLLLDDIPKQQRVRQHPEGWKPYKYKEPSKWKKRHFVCFDGEGFNVDGRHEYVYLAAYDGEHVYDIRNDGGLSSEQCFKFLVTVAARSKYTISVVYGGTYDANMMMRDMPYECLVELHTKGYTHWRDWFIKYAARKYLLVVHQPTKKSCMLWDVIGFFQGSFISSLELWLGVKDKTIARGKKNRNSFTAAEMDFIIDYCKTELSYFRQLMQVLWESLDACGIKLNRWDGAGAVAQFMLELHGIYEHKGTEEQQEQYYYEARCAYAGGRFELPQPGDYEQACYAADINSAYPYGMAQLPPFTGLTKCGCKGPHDVGKFDLVKLDYSNSVTNIHPLFHRHKDNSVSYPQQTVGWHWAPEYYAAAPQDVQVLEHLEWYDNGMRPFAWVGEYYDQRLGMKRAGDGAEKVLKLALASLYGKLAQQKGWHPGEKLPRFHQLYWAGWITANTRAMLYQAMMHSPGDIIACETDAIFSTVKLPLDYGEQLGQWDCTEYSALTYVQSGMYFGVTADNKEVTKYRGLDKGTLKRSNVLIAWTRFQRGGKATVSATSTRFRTLGTSLVGSTRLADWRQWIKDSKKISLLPTGKRLHNPTCKAPWGPGSHHQTLSVCPTDLNSKAATILWTDKKSKEEMWQALEEEWEGLLEN